MWISCKTPPFPYKRVEIKDVNGRIYLGFYALHGCWLETDGHAVIKDPDMWRYIKRRSILLEEFLDKISQRNCVKAMGNPNET